MKGNNGKKKELAYFDCPKPRCGWEQPDDPEKKQKRCPTCKTRTSRGRGKGKQNLLMGNKK